MKLLKFYVVLTAALTGAVLLQACKTKMTAQKASLFEKNIPPAYYAEQTTFLPVQDTSINYSFNNIQFEFNSAMLKPDFYPVLNKTAAEMNKDLSVKFSINGYASNEGTTEHSMALARERCNSVKAYLVNSGVNANNLIAQGYGESNLFVGNGIDSANKLNRRVEIKVLLSASSLFDIKNAKDVVVEP
jgi:OOP family OmpA-OmpF porin